MGGKPESPKTTETQQQVFDYLPPPSLEMRHQMTLMDTETTKDKFIRKFGEEPLIPIGCLCTAGALTYGMYTMKTGDKVLAQRMMRLRVLAQGFTIVAVLSGVFYKAKKSRASRTSP